MFFCRKRKIISTKSIDKVLEKWENIKVEEKHEKSCDFSTREECLKPCRHWCEHIKVQKKAADVGFDWDDVSGAFDKVAEEYAEFIGAICRGSLFETADLRRKWAICFFLA